MPFVGGDRIAVTTTAHRCRKR